LKAELGVKAMTEVSIKHPFTQAQAFV
jgi:hypothetical protein